MRRMLTESEVKEIAGEGVIVTPESLLGTIEGSETVVVDLNEAGTKVAVKLDQDVISDIDSALTKATQAETDIETIDGQIENLFTEVGDLDTNKLDASKSAVATVGGLVIPNSAPAEDKLVGIDTTNGQELIAIGTGLAIENGTLIVSFEEAESEEF